MKKIKGKLKMVGAFLIIMLLCFNNFAAIVSDNDGSAFITKAEFDSLKNSFRAQIDTYNTSIDAKIDGAIAAYLAGIKTSKSVKVSFDSANDWQFPVWLDDGAEKWNKKTSTRYEVANPEIHTYQTSLWRDNRGDSSWVAGSGRWNTWSYFDRASTTVSRTGWSWHKNNIAGEKGCLTEVEKKDEKRKIGTENLTIFDRKQIGHGYKLIYWIADTPLLQNYSSGEYNIRGNYEYGAILGKESGNASKWITNAQEIHPKQISATMVAGYASQFDKSSYKTTLPTGNNRTTQYLTNNNIRSRANTSGGHPTYLNIQEERISAQAVWKDYKRNWVYVKNANMPAETNDDFCYKPHLPSNTTIYRLMVIQNVGWNYYTSHNTVGRYSVGGMTAFSPIVVPYFVTARNSSYLTNDYFSNLPARSVRYYTKDGDEHFMDEGFFILKNDQAGTLKFDIKFDSGDGTSSYNTDVQFAKQPFNNTFNDKDLLEAKVGSDSAKKTNQIKTGQLVSIQIPDLQKGTSIYLKWTNAGSEDKEQICLSSLDNMYLVVDN